MLIMTGFTVIVTLLGIICVPFRGLGIDYEQVTHKFIELVNNNQILAMVISQLLLAFPVFVFYLNRKKLVFDVIRFNGISPITLVLLIVLTLIPSA